MHVSTVWCGANWRKENNMWLILVYRSSNYQGQQTQDETNLERSDVKSWSQSWRKDSKSIFNMSCVIKNISVWPDGMTIWTRHCDQSTTRCSIVYSVHLRLLIHLIVYSERYMQSWHSNLAVLLLTDWWLIRSVIGVNFRFLCEHLICPF